MAKRPDRDPAKHSKKDPAKPTRAKAARPETHPLGPALCLFGLRHLVVTKLDDLIGVVKGHAHRWAHGKVLVVVFDGLAAMFAAGHR